MSCRSLFASLAVLLLLAPVRDARACGPDFPLALLSDRAGTLAELPDGSFALEVSRLLPKPADPFQVVEAVDEPEGAREGGGARETAMYAKGAKAFHAGDLMEARARFQEVLALPPEERRRFSTFAAYMLARTSGAGLYHEARPRFAEVRELARQGFDDPLGLAVASLGEEARLLLDGGNDVGAIRLYAEQAAHGSGAAATSLLLVARALHRDEARLREALKDPLVQRLMTTFVWTRGQEWQWAEESEGGLQRLLEALASVPGLAGADRLAAGAWRVGRFDLAERFAGQERTPLARWVQAKLALRRGDRAAAEQLLAEASKGWPEAEDWTTDAERFTRRPLTRLAGEQGLLALMHGDFTGSAARMLASCSWPDIAYVAERVLSVEELQRLLAAQAPGTAEQCKPELAHLWDDDAREGTNSLSGRLRLLLARRLLRTGKSAEALEHFRGTPWEQPARQYIEARERARTEDDAVDRARALYDAALLARRTGMELLGTEAAPDWAQVDGMYDLSDYEGPRELPPEEDAVRQKMAELPLVSDAERQRMTAHAPPHARRYHYRSTAADLAEEAASLLPKRSQAYAALLCRAARFTASSEPERGQRLWHTYVKHGALLHGRDGMLFGQECPEPDFERARAQQPKLSLPWKGMRRRTLAALGGGLLLPVALGATLFLRRKRKPA